MMMKIWTVSGELALSKHHLYQYYDYHHYHHHYYSHDNHHHHYYYFHHYYYSMGDIQGFSDDQVVYDDVMMTCMKTNQ